MKRAVRTVLGVVLGYVLMGILITLVQEVWFHGVQLGKSSSGVLITVGALTSLAAAFGGVLGTAIARPTGRIAAIVMSGLVVIETSLLIFTGRVSGPLWFDFMAAGSLIAGILVGAELFLRLMRSYGESAAP